MPLTPDGKEFQVVGCVKVLNGILCSVMFDAGGERGMKTQIGTFIHLFIHSCVHEYQHGNGKT